MAKEGILLNNTPAAFLLYISAGKKNNSGLNKPPRSYNIATGLDFTMGVALPARKANPRRYKYYSTIRIYVITDVSVAISRSLV